MKAPILNELGRFKQSSYWPSQNSNFGDVPFEVGRALRNCDFEPDEVDESRMSLVPKKKYGVPDMMLLTRTRTIQNQFYLPDCFESSALWKRCSNGEWSNSLHATKMQPNPISFGPVWLKGRKTHELIWVHTISSCLLHKLITTINQWLVITTHRSHEFPGSRRWGSEVDR